MPLSPRAVRQLFREIRCWQQDGKRAPHKPLMLLFALARLRQGRGSGLVYEEIEQPFKKLLEEFGRPGTEPRPDYPFLRLASDRVGAAKLWDVEAAKPLALRRGNARVTELRDLHATGWFTPQVEEALLASPELFNQVVADLLDDHFEPSLHQDLLDAVAMPWSPIARDRDPEFRRMIIRIYEQRCAICGFDGRLAGADFALEAAHIRWHAAGGSDAEDNGLCLCALHHKALDRGALSIDPERRLVVVSEHLRAGELLGPMFLAFAHRKPSDPMRGHRGPATTNLEWHWNEVFFQPARAA